MPLSELDLIRRIRRAAESGRRKPGQSIGDDCAVLHPPRGHQLLVTTDFTIEDVHFRRTWHPADSVGHRCLARGLSDIAAMGGTPHSAFLSLALPGDLPQRWVDDFVKGLLKLARQYKVNLAGGDTAQSPAGILADVVVIGSVPSGKAVLRSGAKPGDILYVSGTLGVSVASLQQLRSGKKLKASAHLRHFYPNPRLALGQSLRARHQVSAMIDTSDGLSSDLRHLCDESCVGAVVDAAAVAATASHNPLDYALHGGEDYELLFTAPPNRRIPAAIAGTPVTRIGEIVRGRKIKLRNIGGKTQPLASAGWQHFA
jgi:thiamine-monophosphate kinase